MAVRPSSWWFNLSDFAFNLCGCEREALSNLRPLRIPCSDVDFLFKSKRYKFRNSIQQKRACMLIWTETMHAFHLHAFHLRSKVRSNHHHRRRCCCRCCATPVLSSPSIPSSLFSSSSCQYSPSTSSYSHTLSRCTLSFLFRWLDPLVSIYTVVLVLFIVLSIFSIDVFLISHTLSLHSLARWVMIAFDHFRPVSWCCHLSPYPWVLYC